jgi:hypothetical protein
LREDGPWAAFVTHSAVVGGSGTIVRQSCANRRPIVGQSSVNPLPPGRVLPRRGSGAAAMSKSRTLPIAALVLLLCWAECALGSAIPMWEFLTRDEKVSYQSPLPVPATSPRFRFPPPIPDSTEPRAQPVKGLIMVRGRDEVGATLKQIPIRPRLQGFQCKDEADRPSLAPA